MKYTCTNCENLYEISISCPNCEPDHLRSAAPDMYEAIKSFLEWDAQVTQLWDESDIDSIRQSLKKAIAKAEGK